MASAAAISIQKVIFSALFIASFAAIFASGYQFQVGDEMEWRKPTGKERETYNEWAAQNRFHIGDTLHFKYAKDDSVVVASSDDYEKCRASTPIAKFVGGSTVYELNGPGLFYFISGKPGNCKWGQRLIVRVMHPLEVAPPELPPSMEPAPAPAPEEDKTGGGDYSGFPDYSSKGEVCVVSYSVAAFAGLLLLTFQHFV